MTLGIIITVFAGLCGWAGALFVIRHAVGLGLVQAPNKRSSHIAPTPTGGGAGIALAGLVAGIVIFASGQATAGWFCVAGAMMALAGFWDDRAELRWLVRLLVQLLTVGLVIAAIWPVPALALPFGLSLSAPVMAAIVFLTGLWWTNLYNFMDGIDGLAGSQTLFMSVAAAIVTFGAAAADPIWWWFPALASASLGFLMLNWPPAKVFMGDVGSTFIGLILFALALYTVREGWMSYWQWLILGAVFITDATVTLFRRLLSSQTLTVAHRSHAYQNLSRRWSSHKLASLAFSAANLIWVSPFLLLARLFPEDQGIVTLATYVPLTVLALLLKAGKAENA